MSKKILIIEDEPAMGRALEIECKNHGYDAVYAKNGEEGFSAALSEKPDLILLDILMPRMDGLTVLRKLRDDAWGKTAKVIIFTNLQADDQVMAQIIRSEPAYYFIKSDWKIEDLMSKIGEIFA